MAQVSDTKSVGSSPSKSITSPITSNNSSTTTSAVPPVERRKNASGRRKLTPHPTSAPLSPESPDQQVQTKNSISVQKLTTYLFFLCRARFPRLSRNCPFWTSTRTRSAGTASLVALEIASRKPNYSDHRNHVVDERRALHNNDSCCIYPYILFPW